MPQQTHASHQQVSDVDCVYSLAALNEQIGGNVQPIAGSIENFNGSIEDGNSSATIQVLTEGHVKTTLTRHHVFP